MDSLEVKSVVAFQDFAVDTDSSWDASGARSRLRKWASSDGSGDKDTVDFGKYARGFCVIREDGERDDFGTYLLPIADVKNGSPTAIFRGVTAVMAALNGARGGVNIPDEDRRKVYNTHVRRYYKKAGREDDLPELRSFSDMAQEHRALIERERELRLSL